MTVYIYALLEPGTRKPRYVGHTTNMARRLREHWGKRFQESVRDRNPQLNAWICALGKRPEYFIFESVSDDQRFEAEHYYTDLLRRAGANLLNINSGARLSAGHAAKFKAAGSAALTGRKQSPEERARRSGWTHTPETKAAMSTERKGRPKSPETRAKMAAARKAWWERNASATRSA